MFGLGEGSFSETVTIGWGAAGESADSADVSVASVFRTHTDSITV